MGMKSHAMHSLTLLSLGSLVLTAPALRADDWAQWRGPARTGISQEKDWSVAWPAEGPKRLWESPVGVGWSSFSVAAGRAYTMGNDAEADLVYCFDATTGKVIWTHKYDCSSKDPNGYPGTRCTPTVDGDRVYTVSRQGHLFCLDAATGAVKWSKEFAKDFGSKPPTWGFSGSPWIEKGWVLYEVGAKGASVVAFDKATGEVVWKTGDDAPGYSSIYAFDLAGERLFAQFSSDQIIVRRMKDGSETARAAWKTSYGVNATTPIIEGDKLFVSSGYGFGCAVFQIKAGALQEVWRNKSMRTHVNSCVLVDGYLYGFDDSTLKCLDFKTGEVKWSEGKYGKGSVMVAGGKLLLYGGKGQLGAAAPSPDAYKELAYAAQILKDNDTWAPPALANGKLYLRARKQVVCLDLAGR